MKNTKEIICISKNINNIYIHNLTIGKTYYADIDKVNKPDCYWVVNDIFHYLPYEKSIFTTKQEIRKNKILNINEIQNL